MELKKALEITGFVKCAFGPDSDPCDKCGKPNRQHYFRSTGYEHPDEGDYFCGACVKEHAQEIDSIEDIECPSCGEKYSGFAHEKGMDCFDCYAAKAGMPT